MSQKNLKNLNLLVFLKNEINFFQLNKFDNSSNIFT